MFELRRLKMGDRPVTGQGNREVVQDFLTRTLNPTPEEPNRPEAVIVEVQGLVERRPVSSILESMEFRRRLENALRSSIGTVSARRASTASSPPRAPAGTLI